MKLPRGLAIYENLNTAYANFDLLLEDLVRNQFSGYVVLASGEYGGVIFIDSGNLVNVLEEFEGARRTGLATLERVRSRAKDKDGAIGVHRLDSEVVRLIASATQVSPLYEKLSTDLTSLDRLITTLEKEKLTGHIEIELRNQSSGMIFLENGASITAFYTVNGATTVGGSAQEKLAEASRNGAIFNVYRRDSANSLTQDFVRPELIEAWQNVLALVEDEVDKATSPGNFQVAFKQGCLDHVDAFPFLDPFTGRFVFKNGRIQLNGHPDDAQFSGGLTAALTSSVSYLDDRASRALREAMNAAVQTQRVHLDACGLTPAMSQLFG